mmetsp:Transcript_71936/g.203905  ORF Transcript_71936/g.203905 Transcript_71936/m.203905 type:complete len:219 (-) Transcript_71936:1203-1859(-)
MVASCPELVDSPGQPFNLSIHWAIRHLRRLRVPPICTTAVPVLCAPSGTLGGTLRCVFRCVFCCAFRCARGDKGRGAFRRAFCCTLLRPFGSAFNFQVLCRHAGFGPFQNVVVHILLVVGIKVLPCNRHTWLDMIGLVPPARRDKQQLPLRLQHRNPSPHTTITNVTTPNTPLNATASSAAAATVLSDFGRHISRSGASARCCISTDERLQTGAACFA